MGEPASSGPQCLIAGGSGLVGRATSAVLVAAGWRVTTLGRSASRPATASSHLICDLAHTLPPSGMLEGFDAVVNLVAALPGDGESAFEAINVRAAGALAAAAQAAGVRRFVHLSSTRAVTANGAASRITDDDPAMPGDPYGQSKRDGEIAVLAAFQDAMILRPPLILGPGMRGSMARLVAIARGGLPLPTGRLTAPRSYIAVTDLAEAILHLLSCPGFEGRAMLAASRSLLSIAEIVALIRAARHVPLRAFAMPVPLVALATRIAIGADAAAALTQPLIVDPRILPASGWTPRADLAAVITALAGNPETGGGSR
jgi:UDP-glucose 4-epimerase